MNIEQHYISLRKHYGFIKDGECFSVSIDELNTILCCTKRNTQLVLNKLMEQQFIKWQPGRGRGNTSKMTFLQSLHELVLKKAKQLAMEENLEEAWNLVDQLHVVKYDFTEWLYRHFGFHHNDEDHDILRFPFYRPVLNLDPTFVHRRTEADLVNQIFDTLVDYDEKSNRIIPQLAHFWEINEDKTIWRFYLRKGVRFHHGKLMTSKDVEYTFQRILKYSNFANLLTTIKEVNSIGKYVVEFTLFEPNVLFIHYLCLETCSILPHDLDEIQQVQSIERMPIGTGPFRIKKNSESLLALEANDYYYDGRSQIDGIEMWVWPNYDETKMIQRLEKDDIYFGNFSVSHDAHIQLDNVEKGSTYLTFNLNKKGPLQDELLRAAIHYGINRTKMIQELGNMRELPSSSFFPSDSKKHFREEFNLEQAKTLLSNSCYCGETLQLYTYEMNSNEENAKWIQKELKAIGVSCRIVILPIQQLANQAILQKADMIVAGEVLGIQPDIALIEMYSFENGFIYNHLSFQQMNKVQQVIGLCKKEENTQIRKQLLIKLEEELQKQHCFLFLYHTKQTVKHSHLLNGIMLNAWGKVDYKNVWIKKN